MMNNLQELYHNFYIEVNAGTYIATSYSPRHIIRAKDLDELKRKIEDYLKSRE